MAAEDSGRISVSRDALRAELLQLKLDLVKELATKGEVQHVLEKVDALDRRVTDLERRDGDRAAVSTASERIFSRRVLILGAIAACIAVIYQITAISGGIH